MSSGRAHATASLALAPVTWIGVGWATGSFVAGLAAGLGCVAGVLFSPDLDVDSKTVSETVLPGAIGTLFYVWWLPYALCVRHRSWVSHAPVVGTLIRIAYGFWWFLFVDVTWFWRLGWVWVGLAISDLAHWVMDYA